MELLNLVGQLERERSGGRGKLSAAREQVIQHVQARWRELEAHLGRPGVEVEPRGLVNKIQQREAAQRARQRQVWGAGIVLREYPQLVAQDLGTVWRSGADGLAAYYIRDLLRLEGAPQFGRFPVSGRFGKTRNASKVTQLWERPNANREIT